MTTLNQQKHVTFKKGAMASAITLAITSLSFTAYANTNNVKELAVTQVKEEKKDSYKVEKVSSHKYQTELLNTPKTINVVNSEVLKDQGVTSLTEALRNVSGVSTFGAGEGGGGNITTNDKITIRGFSANGNIYVDGIRDIAGYSRDMFNTEQVEVSKGASSSITGKGSSGGAVNLVTKQANQDELLVVNGSYDKAERSRLTLDYNTKISESAAVRINALYTKGGDPFNNGVEDYQTTAIAPSLRIDFNEQTSLAADALFMKQENNPMLGLPWVTEGVANAGLGLTKGPIDKKYWDNYYGVAQRDFEDVSVAIGTLRLEHKVSDKLQIVSQTRIASNEKKSVVSRPIFKTGRDPITDDRTYFDDVRLDYTQNIDQENELFVTQLDAIIAFDTGSIKHNLVVGTEYYQEDVTRYVLKNTIELDSKSVALNTPNPNMPYTGGIFRDGAPTEVNGKGFALSALDTLTISDNWVATLGARYEDYQADGSTYTWARVNGEWFRELVTGLKTDGDFFSYNASIAYKPNQDSNYYFGIANSQDPSAGDLAFSGRGLEGLQENLAMDPQESTNYELGAKWDLFDADLQLAAALFLTEKTVTDRDEDGSYFMGGEQEAKGVEFSATGQITTDLSILASYTHQKTEVTKDTNPLTQGDGLTAAPKDTASIWLDYTLGKLTLGGGAQYSSGNIYWRRNMAYYDSGSITTVNLMAAYDVTDKMTVQLNIDNLTDKSYVTDYSARGHFRPANPRNVKLSVNYQF
ncbi:TonB-dependent siderophore receptor [Pseudoalteromonas sp. NEC-BIFX-2020_015]|uniref:TonB-dependent receptor n=1 Tax=Pseudoalteromonas sp. NEC-BIFX-2020_015 TaxID=2729544 RepID=UPI00146139F2|nr:TonB-dependent siderophore receptor [Pseudoalteromonas sp. NEC-BIFX-2020_015]NMR25389.1 TonB-dependent siderophore receptor [Pseudoalteromonas sp. NEC-BIFX-2020_015]